MRIGLIGAGNIGSTLARLAVEHGHDVMISNSRGPETLAGLVSHLGERATAGTAAQAADFGDVVVVTIPLKNYRKVPAAELANKIVIDTNNYYPKRDGQIPELDSDAVTTSELLAAHLPESRVVKAFNNIYYADLAAQGQPAGHARAAGPAHRRRRRGGQEGRGRPDRGVRLRRHRRRRAGRGAAVPAGHARVRHPPRCREPARRPGRGVISRPGRA